MRVYLYVEDREIEGMIMYEEGGTMGDKQDKKGVSHLPVHSRVCMPFAYLPTYLPTYLPDPH